MGAKPNIRRMPNRWICYTPKSVDHRPAQPEPIPDSVSAEDRQLINLGRQRPVAPEVWREIMRKRLNRYV